MKTSVHPMDVTTLSKGDVITADQIEEITGKRRGSNQYQFAVMGLREWVERQLIANKTPMTLKIEGQDIRVLTDEEASAYSATRFRSGLRTMGKSVYHLQNVDVQALTDQQRVDHSRRLSVCAFVLQAARRAKRSIEGKPEPHQRSLPGPKMDA